MLTKKRIILLVLMVAILVLAPVLAIFSGGKQSYGDNEMLSITIWQIDSFEGGRGSRAQYLKNRANELFEDSRIYVTVTSLSADAARANFAAGNVPDMISYGAGFYGIDKYINSATPYKCWCFGAYLYITLDENSDFSDITKDNTVVNGGRDNLSGACAMFENLTGAEIAAPQSAYVKLINGTKKYLLGTQRDIFRFEARELSYKTKLITSFNDLYQNISILRGGEKEYYCEEYIEYLLKTCEKVSSLGLASPLCRGQGIYSEMEKANFTYTLKSFVGEKYHSDILSAIDGGDINSLKNLLK